MNDPVYDIAIVGSGIACAMTLCQLAERLRDLPVPISALRIGIIDKEGELWNGIPYGKRSAAGALTFQKLQEFLEEPERAYFVEWLAANADSWLNTFRECGGPSAEKWLSDNHAFIERRQWGELYFPRFLFGLYVSGQASNAVKKLSSTGLATVTFIHGEANSILRMPGTLHTITVEDKTGVRHSVQAARVVLAIGSPPQRSIYSGADNGPGSHVHIRDFYSPSEGASIERIQHALNSVPSNWPANVLIVGSNASALEALYLINYRPEIRNSINSIVVLSYSGMLPYKICEEEVPFELEALGSLHQRASFSAADLMAAIKSDIRKAEERKLNIADLRDSVAVSVSKSMTLMQLSEQEKFVCQHGVHYSRTMRRAGRDTRNAADELASLGILTTVKGELRSLKPSASGNGLVSATYLNESDREIAYPVPFSISINCGGFEELDSCSSPLINSLIENQICRINSTRRGFLVNERLEASENVYVIGPLVAGNFNAKIRYWHVESASRIIGLAKLLAMSLSESLTPLGEYPRWSNVRVPEGLTSRESSLL